jgi:hypothetical protein
MDSSYLTLLGKGGPSDSQVYDVMALRAFDELSTKLQDHFFQPLPKAPPKPSKAPKPSFLDDDDE